MNPANDAVFVIPQSRDFADKPLEPVLSAGESDISNVVLEDARPKKRRRSSLLQRLTLFENRPESEASEGDKESQDEKQTEEPSSNSGQSKVDKDPSYKMDKLREYADQLNAECITWRTTRQKWKEQYKSTISELNEHPMVLDETSSLEFLTDEDRKFLNDRPDYAAIKQEMQEGLELATLCMVMEERYQNAMQRLVNMARDRQEPIRKYILNMD